MKKLSFLFAFTLLVAVSASTVASQVTITNETFVVQDGDDNKKAENASASSDEKSTSEKDKKESCKKTCSTPCEKK
ncbi:MAG: hypothetical protein JW894_07425 [Bacteroidales bacterium]|nr:hypothetical protein [Bacteroidales bacterium]